MNEHCYLGLDIGSTTVKTVVLSPDKGTVLASCYQRHHAEQARTVLALLTRLLAQFPGNTFRIAICGSGGKPIAEQIGAHYVQEVVANAAAVRSLYPQARTAIELGGQDAKIIFFYYDEAAGRLVASDMRMNGSCAGGTGAFIDEIAALLHTPVEEFEALAASGTTVHSISGRCGVFAKTDIQSILNGGGKREDIALSAFHAIAKQTIGGLAQGLELKAPIIFEGGPLTFNPTLVRVFEERLELRPEDVIHPEHPDTIVAHGAALALDDLFPLAAGQADALTLAQAIAALEKPGVAAEALEAVHAAPFFADAQACAAWQQAHAAPARQEHSLPPGTILPVYIGVDAGSTTSKIVLLDENEQVFDSFYAPNQGDPIRTVQQGLQSLSAKYAAQGVDLQVLGLGTTGYGERMLAAAFGADYHTVETVAHAAAARKYVPDVSFILDIGGQDMKAIWVSDDIVTNITLNESCSSGCGSFLENFAASLHIPVSEIAAAAFRSTQPAQLGSRCTVFMNSAIITEQKNGRSPDDIMAGLCRSIIENVFTKVVRISNTQSLGRRIVAQGGTFKNDAVLRALEQYLGCPVTRAPYSGEMGAVGAALLTRRQREAAALPEESHFIGFHALEDFQYTQLDNQHCPHCANHCNRSIVHFSSGAAFVTGNRCPRGEVLEGAANTARKPARDLYLIREQLLVQNYPCTAVCAPQGQTIGLPRVLEFWDSLPFWNTFFRALGYGVKISKKSSRALYEQGIGYVVSDTVCFPAKLAHGHILDLQQQGVDRIFMPMVMKMPAMDQAGQSNHVCAVVKGYPLLVKHAQNPAAKWNIQYDNPIFEWLTLADRRRQIREYFTASYGLEAQAVEAAYAQADSALEAFRQKLLEEGAAILRQAEEAGSFAVVLAGRPYHNDALVSHDLSRAFAQAGVPVLTVDALPGLGEVNLRYTRAEVTNSFHTRMLASAVLAAQHPALEYVQIVSFGCGHDAILSDEITRILQESSGKSPLILKLDEGGAANSLNIRVQSFLETVATRRGTRQAEAFRPLEDAYPVKFHKQDKKRRIMLVPNVSAAFCRLLSGVLQKQGLRAEPLPMGGRHEIQLGKQYVHNDTCFPAQMCIGEALSALQSGKYPRDAVAVGMAKYCGDCRLSHYSALCRRAMDAAGFADVPIISTDPVDTKEMHPEVRLGNLFNISCLWAITMMDFLEELRRQIRPYELQPGQTNRVFDAAIEAIGQAIAHGVAPAIRAYQKAIGEFCKIPYDRSQRRPRVFITGEYLVTFHPGSNFGIEEYLERNGMEVILPRMINVFRKDYLARIYSRKVFHVQFPAADAAFDVVAEKLFQLAQRVLEKEARRHPLYEPAIPLPQLAEDTEHIIHRTFLSGEGWLIPGEIAEYAARGVRAFIVLQPFGCLPNHIVGRGTMKKLKEDFPAIQILPLDFDPDTSFANIENRLQMLIMNEKSR